MSFFTRSITTIVLACASVTLREQKPGDAVCKRRFTDTGRPRKNDGMWHAPSVEIGEQSLLRRFMPDKHSVGAREDFDRRWRCCGIDFLFGGAFEFLFFFGEKASHFSPRVPSRQSAFRRPSKAGGGWLVYLASRR